MIYLTLIFFYRYLLSTLLLRPETRKEHKGHNTSYRFTGGRNNKKEEHKNKK